MRKSLLQLTVSILFVCTYSNVYSQFNDALSMSYSYGITPISSQNTGNDILDAGGISYEVIVSDDPSGNNSILGYKVGTTTGFVFIGQGNQVLDPDVCLITNSNGTLYAVVAYYDVTLSQFMWQVLTWMPGQNTFDALPPDMISAGVYNKSINIDSDDVGHFAIVWDEPGNNIFMVFGGASGGNPPQLALGGNALALDIGSEPDICYYRNAANNYWQIDVVYKRISGNLAVDLYKLDDLLAGVVVPTPAFRSPLPDLIYRNPRIACPITATGEKEDFTVVVEDTDGNSTWYIKSFNSNKCCTPTIQHNLYNDGGTNYSPFNLTMVPNTKPVVAYDDSDAGIWVGWNIDNSWGLVSAPGAPIGKYPIALATDKRGMLSQTSKYLVVPYGTTYNTTITNLAIAGSKSANVMFTYNDIFPLELYSKSLPHSYLTSQNLRSNYSGSNIISWLNGVERDKFDCKSMLTLNLYDITGKLIFKRKGTASGLLQEFRKINLDEQPKFYMAQIFSTDGTLTFSGKIVL